jgi:hypothetical protein
MLLLHEQTPTSRKSGETWGIPAYLIIREDDFGVEEGAGYAGGDGQEVGLSGEDFDVAGAGDVGEVDGAAVADAGGGGLVGGGFSIFICTEQDSRFPSARFACSGQALHFASLSLLESEASVGMTNFHFLAFDVPGFDFVEGVGLGEVEFGDGGAAEGFEVGSGAEELAHFVGDGAHVRSGGDAGAEVGTVVVEGEDYEFFDLDLYWLEGYFLLFAREFVGGDAVDFFRGERRGSLFDQALEFGG